VSRVDFQQLELVHNGQVVQPMASRPDGTIAKQLANVER